MGELKHGFGAAKMNKDADERIVPSGEYRDALNIEISTSEDSNVGTMQTLLGNSNITNYQITASIGFNAKCVGSVTDEKNNNLYYFIADKDNHTDYIFQYNSDSGDLLPIVVDKYELDVIISVTSTTDPNVTVAGVVVLTGKTNRNTGTNGDITISMTATKSNGNLLVKRQPQFSNIDSESSDFSNTLNTVTKRVREGDCKDRDIVHLNNVTGIRVGMIVIGGGIDTNKTITVKSITGTAVKLSEKQTIQKDDMLSFSSMFNMRISGLTATLSANGGLTTGVCTVTGTGKITTFGIDSFTSTLSLDNFLSIV